MILTFDCNWGALEDTVGPGFAIVFGRKLFPDCYNPQANG